MRANRVARTLVRTTLTVAMAATVGVSLQGCILAVAGAAGGGALIATDRRTVGTQTEDREIQVKAISQTSQQLPDTDHVNVTVFNRRVLLTGEVAGDADKQRAEQIVRGINNVNDVVNELAVMPKTDFSSRANDSYLEGKVKAGLIAEKGISANDFKVVGERGNIYLMGLVTPDEGARGADVASRAVGVKSVVKVFQYIRPDEARALETSAASGASASGAAAAPAAEAAPTVGAVPAASVTSQPLDQQAPAPISNSSPAKPAGKGAQ